MMAMPFTLLGNGGVCRHPSGPARGDSPSFKPRMIGPAVGVFIPIIVLDCSRPGSARLARNDARASGAMSVAGGVDRRGHGVPLEELARIVEA